ncbi:hypothetical protein CIPAW_05G204400 [Carya illinoinensis]|uniref:Uncharacterized protein n=1 Tax=Carya illinoinensis TaxID=32201 RepID=A0A8T1QKM3_CARIL|nr:hypothetical protein CIPAW_05G204400 [Carya illinoinensis]
MGSRRQTVARMEVRLGGELRRPERELSGWVVSATSPTSGGAGRHKQPATERKKEGAARAGGRGKRRRRKERKKKRRKRKKKRRKRKRKKGKGEKKKKRKDGEKK